MPGESSFALSGDTVTVEHLLDGWKADRSRDLLTGDIAHPRLVESCKGVQIVRR
jgi:hypothetical protein